MLAGINRWHPFVVLIRQDPSDQDTLIGLARHDRPPATRFEFRHCALGRIKPQSGFPFRLIEAMTGVTVVGQDRTYVAVELKRCVIIGRQWRAGQGSDHDWDESDSHDDPNRYIYFWHAEPTV